MANKTEQTETANGGAKAAAKAGSEVDGSRHSVPERSDVSDDNEGSESQTATLVLSTEQSSIDEPTHESNTERTASSATNHQLWPDTTPYGNVDGKFVFTFDRPTTWHVKTVINDTSVVTVELAPSTEREGARSHVLRIKQTLQPIETERLERYQPNGKTTDPLQFGGRAVAVSITTQKQSHQWTIILPDDSGSYLVQLTTDHIDDTTATSQIDGEPSDRTEELRQLGIQVLYSFRPTSVETVAQ